MWGVLSMEEFVLMDENSHEGAQDFFNIKKNEKINMKKFFSTESKEQH